MPRPHDVVEAKHDVVKAKHDVVEAKHDVIEAKHDVIKAKPDVIEAKHDVIKAKHDVICLLQFAKSFFPCLLGGALGGGRRRRRPSYAHGGLVMRPDQGVIALIKPPCGHPGHQRATSGGVAVAGPGRQARSC